MPTDQWKVGRYPSGDDATRAVEERFISFVATARSGESVLLGSGFLLLSQGSIALCATAAHVIAFAADVQQPLRESERRYEELFGLAPRNRLRIEPESFRAIWLDSAGRPHALIALQVCRSNENDVAAVWLSPQHGDDCEIQFPHAAFPVGPSLPARGSEVVAVGHLAQPIGIQVVEGEQRSYRLERTLGLRWGHVSDVDEVGTYMGIGPNFTTTIPLPPGASGAPIFEKAEAGEPMVVRGLVSSDLSPPDAFDDTTLAGAGRGASILSLLRLPISAATRRPIADLYRGEPINVDLSPPDA
jgi:hypothetical protein